MKAILIARVSTEEQREAGNSLPAQIARLEKYCQNKGFDVSQVCSFDESAYSNDRSEFDRIIDLILSQQNKVIVCCDKVDRLSRNVFDKRISILYEKALSDQIELHFVSDGQIINSRISAVEKFQFGISLGLAKYYSDAISDNVKRAIEQKLRKGEWTAKAPYGYKNIRLEGDKKDIVVDEYEASVIKKAFDLYATGAYSLIILCDKMRQEHRVTWNVSYLDKIFNNSFYYGVMKIKGKGYPHRYPPIIDKALFDQVQTIKSNGNKKRSKFAGKPYIYRGLIKCADCGLSITPEKHKGHVYYHCTQYNGKHNAQWLREEEITRQLELLFKRLQIPPELAEEMVHTLNTVHQEKVAFQAKHIGQLKRDHKTVTEMLDNLYLDKLKGRITESEYDKFYQRFKDQLTDIVIRMDQLQEADSHYHITAKYVLKIAQRAYDLFVSSEVEEKRQLLKLVLSNLTLKDESLVYDVHKPFDLLLKCSDDISWRP